MHALNLQHGIVPFSASDEMNRQGLVKERIHLGKDLSIPPQLSGRRSQGGAQGGLTAGRRRPSPSLVHRRCLVVLLPHGHRPFSAAAMLIEPKSSDCVGAELQGG
jgi:hypothetical protein